MNLSKLQEILEDRWAWHAVVHGVTQSRTWLNDWTTILFSIPLSILVIFDFLTIAVLIWSDISLLFWFTFPWWLMILSTSGYTFGHLSSLKDVYSGFLPIFKWSSLVVIIVCYWVLWVCFICWLLTYYQILERFENIFCYSCIVFSFCFSVT